MVGKIKRHPAGAGEGFGDKTEEPQRAVGESEAGRTGETDMAEDLQVKLEDAEKRAAENYDKYIRTVAELDNYRKRAAREKADAIQYGNENLLRDILPLVDGMDRALEHASSSEDFEAFRKGLKMLQEQLLCCLQKHGVEMIDTAGKDFDPHVHEAMMQMASAGHQDSQVVSEFERGYLLNGRLLRPAKVCVCKNPAGGGDRENHDEEA